MIIARYRTKNSRHYWQLKPGFHMIVRIAPVVSKYFETIRTTGVIGSFHMIVSIALKARDAGSSAMQKNFCACFANKPHKWMIFIRKANLAPWYLLFLLILRRWEARRVPPRHSISSKTWCHGLSLISNNPHKRCEHLCIIFSASAPSWPNLFSIIGIKVMISGIVPIVSVVWERFHMIASKFTWSSRSSG